MASKKLFSAWLSLRTGIDIEDYKGLDTRLLGESEGLEASILQHPYNACQVGLIILYVLAAFNLRNWHSLLIGIIIKHVITVLLYLLVLLPCYIIAYTL